LVRKVLKGSDAVAIAAEFNNPQEIVESKGLTRGQKLEALKRWLFDVERRLASAAAVRRPA